MNRSPMFVIVGLLFVVAACAVGESPPGADDGDGGRSSTSADGTGPGATVGSGAAPGATTSAGPSGSSAASSTSSTTGSGGGVIIAPANMIDDMEAGSASIITQGGRVGAWYSYNDGTAGGTQVPAVMTDFLSAAGGHDASSTKSRHTNGMGFATWGAGAGLDLNNSGAKKATYDVSSFTGIAFWAKGTPGSLRFKVLTSDTVAAAEGGTCATACGDSHGSVIALTLDWAEYVVPFSSLAQEGWGTAAAWNPAAVLSVQFQVGANAAFDFWVDDIGLY